MDASTIAHTHTHTHTHTHIHMHTQTDRHRHTHTHCVCTNVTCFAIKITSDVSSETHCIIIVSFLITRAQTVQIDIMILPGNCQQNWYISVTHYTTHDVTGYNQQYHGLH